MTFYNITYRRFAVLRTFGVVLTAEVVLTSLRTEHVPVLGAARPAAVVLARQPQACSTIPGITCSD